MLSNVLHAMLQTCIMLQAIDDDPCCRDEAKADDDVPRMEMLEPNL